MKNQQEQMRDLLERLSSRVSDFNAYEADSSASAMWENGVSEVRSLTAEADELLAKIPAAVQQPKGFDPQGMREYLKQRRIALGLERDKLRAAIEDYEELKDVADRGIEALDEAVEAISEVA